MELRQESLWDEAEEKDPRIWRYTFDGEKMHVQGGRFVFD